VQNAGFEIKLKWFPDERVGRVSRIRQMPIEIRSGSVTAEPCLAKCAQTHHSSHIMQAVTDRLKNFLQYVAVNLIEEPSQAQLKVAELGPKKLRFKLILARQDVAMLIGRNGFTASAIRSVLKAAAEKEGFQVSLQIHSHEEETEMLARDAGH
jgi:predicted RNA-binding protein YlqC (UPF0109 family)